MSESQERRAKRLVEILVEMGFIEERKSKCGVFWVLDIRYADLIQKFTEALTKLETEELKLILARARRQAKCSQCVEGVNKVTEANFLVRLHHCPKCGEYGVRFGHFDVSKDGNGWLGLKCTKCGWTQKNKYLTKKMLIDNRELKKFADKRAKRKTKK